MINCVFGASVSHQLPEKSSNQQLEAVNSHSSESPKSRNKKNKTDPMLAFSEYNTHNGNHLLIMLSILIFGLLVDIFLLPREKMGIFEMVLIVLSVYVFSLNYYKNIIANIQEELKKFIDLVSTFETYCKDKNYQVDLIKKNQTTIEIADLILGQKTILDLKKTIDKEIEKIASDFRRIDCFSWRNQYYNLFNKFEEYKIKYDDTKQNIRKHNKNVKQDTPVIIRSNPMDIPSCKSQIIN